MKKFMIISILTLCLACQKRTLSTHDAMKSDPIISEIFTEQEVKDLTVLVDFFEDNMCKEANQGNKESLKVCYENFNAKNKKSDQDGYHLKFIDIEEQRNLYKQLDSATVSQIWRNVICYPDTLTLKENLTIRAWDGKYYEFVKTVGKKDSIFEEYAISMSTANDLSPGNHASFLFDQYDVEDIKVRFLYTIHFLTLNESLDLRINNPCLLN